MHQYFYLFKEHYFSRKLALPIARVLFYNCKHTFNFLNYDIHVLIALKLNVL